MTEVRSGYIEKTGMTFEIHETLENRKAGLETAKSSL